MTDETDGMEAFNEELTRLHDKKARVEISRLWEQANDLHTDIANILSRTQNDVDDITAFVKELKELRQEAQSISNSIHSYVGEQFSIDLDDAPDDT